MKVLQINSVINSDSTGHIAEEIGLTAIQAGWESYIAFGRNDRPSKSNKIKIGTDLDVKWHGVITRLFDRHGLASCRATRKLVKEIKEIQPDIIHLHNIHGYYLNIKILFDYLATADIPVVWTLHDCWTFTGHCAHFSYINCDKWKIQCDKCPQKNEYPASFVIDNSYNNFRLKKKLFTNVKNMTLVPVSNWLNSLLQESFLNIHPSQVIHNGIDLNTFKPTSAEGVKEKYSLSGKFVLLGVASTWNEKKGLHDYFTLSNHLEEDEIIIIIGLTQNHIKSLPDNIIGMARTQNVSELVEFYSVANVVLSLSVEETFGMTTVEGYACGTPGIVYNCTASPELITDQTGLIVEQGNIDKLLKAIKQIKQNGKQYYSDACVERAQKFYRKEDRYQEYIDLYESMLH